MSASHDMGASASRPGSSSLRSPEPQSVSAHSGDDPSRVPFAPIARMATAIIGKHQCLPHDTVVSRIKQWQKFGYWGIPGLGKGNFGRYSRGHVVHVAILCELSNMGITPEAGSCLARSHRDAVIRDGSAGELTTVEVTANRSGIFLDSPRLMRLVNEAFA